ncbi:MAG: peptidase M15 [Deltaproteobacteria bacterium]|nr:peptidase M15 [Deltaproteobacteria bacterium]
MQITENFSLEELTKTSTGLPNLPGKAETEKLLLTAAYLLEPVRKRWGKIRVTSAFRSEAVNARVGGSSTSQHVKGEAADIVPVDADLDEVFGWIAKDGGICFGQAIREKKGGSDWIHLSLPRVGGPNQQRLVYDGKGYAPYV